MEEGERAGGGFVREELCEGEAGMIVDGDVEILPARAADMIMLAIPGDAVAGALDAGELFDVEVDEFARVGAFVALDRRRWGELREAVAVPVEEAGDGGLGELGSAGDLEAGPLAAAQGEHARDPQRVGGAGGTLGSRRAVLESGEPLGAKAGQPLEGGADGDSKARRDRGHGLPEVKNAVDHLGSTQRREFGLTVGVHAAGVLGWVLLSQPHLSKSSTHEQPI